MRSVQRSVFWAVVVVSSCVVAFAQTPAPQGGAPAAGRGAAPRLVLSVSSPAWSLTTPVISPAATWATAGEAWAATHHMTRKKSRTAVRLYLACNQYSNRPESI